jgi:hypothetical protein
VIALGGSEGATVAAIDQFEGEHFTSVRNKYIETFHLLQHAKELDALRRILGEWRGYISSFRANEICTAV